MNKDRVIGLEEEIQVLGEAVKNKHHALLISDTGCGKTHLVRALANKQGKTVKRVPLNGEVGINELLGKWLIRDGSTYWQDGILVECMKNGDWILLDEINAALPEVLFCLNSVMDDSKSIILSEKNNEMVITNDDFRLFATMNPTAEYAGTKELNKALLSRFAIVIWMKNYIPSLEKDILMYHTEIDEFSARVMVDVANSIRKLKDDRKIFYTCSVRDLISWANLFKQSSLGLETTFRYAVLNKSDEEEREHIFMTAKKASDINVDWSWTQGVIAAKLTTELREQIDALEKKKSSLRSSVSRLKKELQDLSCEVEK